MKAKSKVTLKDISQRTGFDKSTISRVLRNDATLSIRQENIDLIKQAAKEMNYVPDAAGRSLRSARSFSIGALVPSLQNPVHSQIVEGAAEACLKRGYSLIIAHAADGKRQMDVIHDMIERNSVDGLLALTFRNEYLRMTTIPQFDVPVMAVNWRAPGFNNWVAADELSGARLIMQHLIDLGHRRIAHISGDPERFNPHERLAGYQETLASAGVPYDPELVQRGGYSYEEGAAAMNALLDRKQGHFTAVFVLGVLAAAGALGALKKRGVQVPQDVSMVSFHDTLMGRVMSPSLTTVAYPLVTMGEVAATGLMDILDGRSESFTRVIGGPQLFLGESSAPV